MNNTNENNKLIAQFMQLELISNKEYEIKRKDMIKQNIAYDLPLTLDDLKYHSSWDWLMPVIEKIESYERYDVNILQYGTIIYDNQKEMVNNIADISFDTKIEHTYDAIVKFIKYYNTIK